MRDSPSITMTMKRSLVSILIALILTPLAGGFVSAAEVSSATEPAMTDFETRRAVLMKVFELSETEILDLQKRMEEIGRPDDPTYGIIYSAINDGLKEHLQLVQSRIQELGSSYITLDGIRVTAEHFKKWRESVYDPGTRELFDFLILYQGANIVRIVDERYEKVVGDVMKLQNSLDAARVDSLNAMLADVKTRLVKVHELDSAARSLFLKNFRERHGDLVVKLLKAQERQDALASAVDVISADSSDEAISPSGDQTVQGLMKSMVAEIAEIYKIFLSMRDIVRSA